MNEHDRVVFDLKGYIVKPAVLNKDGIKILKEFVLRQKNEPESLPPPKEKLDKIGQPSLVLGLELLIFRSWQAKRATY
jgi:hypothetical protein